MPYVFSLLVCEKPATPFTKIYSVLECSNFNDIGGAVTIQSEFLFRLNVNIQKVIDNAFDCAICAIHNKNNPSVLPFL